MFLKANCFFHKLYGNETTAFFGRPNCTEYKLHRITGNYRVDQDR